MSAADNEKFKKLLIIPQKLFNEWKNILNGEKNLSYFDKLIKNVLKRKNLSDDQKWNMYKYQMLKFANLKKNLKKNRNKLKSRVRSTEEDIPDLQKSQSPKKKQSFIQSPPPRFTATIVNKGRVSEPPVSSTRSEDNTISFEESIEMKDDVYEHIPQDYGEFESQLPNNNVEKMDVGDDRFLAGEKYDFDHDLEFALHEAAQQELGSLHPSDVVRKDKTLGMDYRSFYDKRTGSDTMIEVEPVKEQIEKLYNESGRLENHQSETVPDLEKSIVPQTKRTRGFITKKPPRHSKSLSIERPEGKLRRTKKIIDPLTANYTYNLRSLAKNFGSKVFTEKEVSRVKRNKWESVA